MRILLFCVCILHSEVALNNKSPCRIRQGEEEGQRKELASILCNKNRGK